MQLAKYEGVRLAQLGEDDFRNPSLLEDALQHLIEYQIGDRIVLDLSRVQSLTSVGVAVLVAARGIAIVHNARLAIAGVQPRVRRLFETIGAEALLRQQDMPGDIAEALPKNAPNDAV
jgi:anti-anti-sigma factor